MIIEHGGGEMRVYVVIRDMIQKDGVTFPVILGGYKSRGVARGRVFTENGRLELRKAAQAVGCSILNRIQEVEVE